MAEKRTFVKHSRLIGWGLAVILLLGAGGILLYVRHAAAVDFEVLECHIKPFWSPQEETRRLTFRADGTCVYTNDGRPALTPDSEPWAARTYEHTLSDEQKARLRACLARTRWLTHRGFVSQASRTHPTTITITMHFDGETRQVVCQGQQDEPYDRLIWFIHTIAQQERALYLLDEVDERERLSLCRNLAGQIDGLRGESGRAVPVFEVNYQRYVPKFREYVATPDRYLDKDGWQLIAAVKVLAYTRTEAAYADIAALALHENHYVRRAAIAALGDIGRPEYVDHLVKAGESGSAAEYSAWALIRMGDVAVPAIAEVLAANRGDLAYKLVRQYINHWDELPGPLDERIVAALQAGMPKRDDPYDAYYGYVLDLVRARPIEPAPMLGRLDGRNLVRCEPSAFVHGWYTLVDGRINRYDAAPTTDVSADRLTLKMFEPRIAGHTLRFTTGWTNPRYIDGRAPIPVEQTVKLAVPDGSQLERDYVYNRRDMPTGSYGNIVRLTDAYQLLWQGRVVKDGRDVLTLAYIGKLARPTDAGRPFCPPKRPLTYQDPPAFRR